MMNTTRTLSRAGLGAIALAVLAACQSLPANNAQLEKTRNDYRAAADDPRVRELAKPELQRAEDAVKEADRAWTRNEPPAEVDHLAYLAKQRVAIATLTADRKSAELTVANAAAARAKLRLDARTGEADAARMESQASQRSSDAARREADAARSQVATEQVRNVELQAQLQALNAKSTDRGMVITLGDVLFDTSRASLKAGGLRSVDKLVEFLNRYPQRKAMVEGFTDSTGSEAVNEALSGRRADAVRSALLERGVGGDRVLAKGYGEAFPVAGNDTAAGRQLNRRVEIVLSDDQGKVVAR